MAIVSNPRKHSRSLVKTPLDDDANAWFEKHVTDSKDLVGVLSYFISAGMPTEALDDFLVSIMPTSGWCFGDEPHYDPVQGTRSSREYGAVMHLLMKGLWTGRRCK